MENLVVVFKDERKRYYYEATGLDREEFRVTAHNIVDEIRIVKLIPVVSRKVLVDKLAIFEYIAKTSNTGLVLYELHPEEDKTSAIYASDRATELLGTSFDDLRDYGFEAAGRKCFQADRIKTDEEIRKCTKDLTPAGMPFRMFINGEYVWRDYSFGFGSGDGGKTVYIATTLWDFAKHSEMIEAVQSNKSYNLLLSSFILSLFDISLHIDDEFNILSDSTRLRQLFHVSSTSPLGKLTDYIELLEDKNRFADYVATRPPLNAFITNEPDESAINESVISLTLMFDGGTKPMKQSIQLFATPALIEGSSESSATPDETSKIIPQYGNPVLGMTTIHTRKLLVAIKFGTSAPLSRKFTNPPEAIVPVQTVDDDWFNDATTTDATLITATLNNTESIFSESVTSETTGLISSRRSVRDGLSIPNLMVRCLHRMLTCVVEQLHKSQVSEANTLQPSTDWLVLLFDGCEFGLVMESLLILVPRESQSVFYRAGIRGDYPTCSTFLSRILESDGGSDRNSFLLLLVFKFMLGMSVKMSSSRAISMLQILGELRERICRTLGDQTGEGLSLELALVYISHALMNPQLYNDRAVIASLCRVCNAAISVRQSLVTDEDRGSILPVIYWVCILWSGFLRKLGNTSAGYDILIHTARDIAVYNESFPEMKSVRTLQMIVLHNLAVECFSQGDSMGTYKWVLELQKVSTESNVPMLDRTKHLIEWANDLQTFRPF
jgi:hypothetical protein